MQSVVTDHQHFPTQPTNHCTPLACSPLSPSLYQGATPALWAASSSSFLKPEEIANLSKGITDQGTFDTQAAAGFQVGGEKYMKINSELGKVVRGKKGDQAVAAALSKRAIVVARGKASPQEISLAVEKMAADLAGKGF